MSRHIGIRCSVRVMCGLMLSASLVRGAFYDIEDAAVPALPAGWTAIGWQSAAVASDTAVEPNRGTTALRLADDPSGPWLLSPENITVTNAVVDFSCRYTNGVGIATVEVWRVTSGVTNALGEVGVPLSAEWRHVTLYPEPALAVGETNRYLFTLSNASSGAVVEVDNVYFGRGLPEADSGRIVYSYEAADGTGASGMWWNWIPPFGVTWDGYSGVLGGRTGDVLRARTGSTGVGAIGYLSPFACLPEVPSDSFVIELDIYNLAGSNTSRNDRVQLLGSTNDWASALEIGSPVYRYDASVDDKTWHTKSILGYVSGLDDSVTLRLGLQAIAAGSSGQQVYIDNLSIRYITTVAASDMRYVSWDGYTETVAPWGATEWGSSRNDNPYVSLTVEPRPPEDVTNMQVELVHDRVSMGVVETNVLVQVGTGNVWRTAAPVGPFEGGETNRYQAKITFASASGAATNSPVYFPGPDESEWQDTTVSGARSVWVNEIAADWVELAAPEGRAIPADPAEDWRLLVESGTQSVNYILSAEIFTNSVHHGIAFAHQSLDPALAGELLTGQLHLLNGAGLVEFSQSYDLSGGGAWSAQGTGPYVGDDDFAGYGEVFSTWSATSGTRGERNAGQEFETLVEARVQVTGTVSYASVQIAVPFSSGTMSTSLLASATGDTAVVVFEGEHTNAAQAEVTVTGAAFGWLAPSVTNVIGLEASLTNHIALPMGAGVGRDSFVGTAFSPYWEVMIDPFGPSWTCNERARCATASVGVGGASRLRVQNNLNSRGRQHVSVSLQTQNTFPSNSNRIDKVYPTFTTNEVWGTGEAHTLPAVINRYQDFPVNAWVDYHAVMPIDAFGASDVWFTLDAKAAGSSGKQIHLDALRVAFQDMVTAENLLLLPALTLAGQPSAVSVDLIPRGTSVSSVTAALIYQVNGGGWQTNANLLAGAQTLAAPTNVVLADAMGPFVEGDVVKYYVSVSYDPNDGDPETGTETRFYPDNSAVDAETGAWVVIGDYEAEPLSLTVQGIPPVWFNEINPNLEAAPEDHFIELAGWTNISIGGYRVEVEDLTNGVTDAYTIPANTFATNNITNVYGFYVLGGNAEPARQQALTNALPRHGGLKLLDTESNVVHAVSYDAGGESVASNYLEYVYLGNAGGLTLAASGDGNPGNESQFDWVSTSNTSAGAFNDGQTYTNAAPIPDPPLFQDPLGWTKATNSLTVTAELSTDMHKPLEYRIQASGQDSGWSTARELLVTNLSENTGYTFTLAVRDALGAQTASSTTDVFTSVATPTQAPVVSGTATNAVSVRLPAGAVANLGVGDTSIRYRGPVGGETAWSTGTVTVTDSAMTPNQLYTFESQARNGDAIETAWGGEPGEGYTLAVAPITPPMLTQEGSDLRLSVTNAIVAGPLNVDDNPTNTQYAVAVWSPMSGSTNYLTTAGDVQSSNAWAVLPDWGGTNGIVADVDTTVTNAFALIARNGDSVLTSVGPSATSVFHMAVSFAETPEQLDGEQGQVSAVADIENPWMNDTQLQLAYSSDEGASWSNATLADATAAYGDEPVVSNGLPYQISGVETGTGMTNQVNATWNALADLGGVFDGQVWVRWSAFDPTAQRPAQAPATSAAVSLDLESPTGTITRLDGNPTNAPTLHFQVVFDETVTGLTTGSITKHESGVVGTIASVTGAGMSYTVTVTSVTGDGTFGISIPADEVVDQVGNGNAPVGRVDYAIDQTRPNGVVTCLGSNPTSAENLYFQIAFDEIVTGVTTTDVTKHESGVTGTVASVIGEGTAYTVTVASITGDGTFGISVAENRCSDLAGNGNTSLAEVSYTVDQSPPIPGTAVIGGGAESVILSLTNLTLSLSWQDFAEQGSPAHTIVGYYYSLEDQSGSSNGVFTTATSGIFSNVPRGVVTGFVWAVDQVGNIGTSSAFDSMTVYYEASAFAVTGMPVQVAGSNQVIEVRAIYDETDPGTVSDAYIGLHEVVFSGANVSRAGTWPTATDVDGIPVPFGIAMDLDFDAGIASATMRLVCAESAIISLSDGVVNAASNALAVTVQPAEKATLFYGTLPPTQVVAGVNWSDFTVEISDSFGNKTGGDTNAVTVHPSPGAFVGGPTTVEAVDSVAVFTGLTYRTSGTIDVYAEGLSATATAVVQTVVLAADAVSYALSVIDSPEAGSPVNLTVAAEDIYGNLASAYSGPQSLLFSGALPSPSGTQPTVDGIDFGSPVGLTFGDGSATATLYLYRAGPTGITVTNSAEGKAGGPLNITVSRAAITGIEWKTQPPSNVAVNTLWSPSPEVRLRDPYHNPVTSGNLITLEPSKGAGIAGAFVGADGVASFSSIIYTVPGVYRIKTKTTLSEGSRESPYSGLVLVHADTATVSRVISTRVEGADLILAFTNELFVLQHQVERSSDLAPANWNSNGVQVSYELDAGSWMSGSGEVWRATVELPATNHSYYRIVTPEP